MKPEEASGIKITKGSFIRLLKNKDFLRLWSAQIISLTAQNMVHFALLTRIFELSGGKSFATSMLLVVLTLPAIFLASYAGMVADKNDRRAILISTNFLRALAVLLFFVVSKESQALGLIFFYINAFAFSGVNQFFVPAEAAAIPELVKKEELLKANALFTQTLYITFILGISIAGPIQSVLGTMAPFWIASIMFGIAAVVVWKLPKMKKLKEEVHVSHFLTELFTETFHTLKLIKSRLGLAVPVLHITIAQVVIGVMVVLSPPFVNDILKLSVKQSGLLVTPAGVGMMVAAVLIGIVEPKNRSNLIKIGFFALGLSLIALSNIREIAHFLNIERLDFQFPVTGGLILTLIALVFIMGIELAAVYVPAQTALQENSESEIRGRVFGFLNMSINISATLPLLLAGVLADIFEIKIILFYFGVLLLIYALIDALFLSKKLKF